MGLLDFLGKKPLDGLTIEETLIALSKGAILIDVRTQPEYEAGHAPGARPVDPKSLASEPLDAIHGDDPLADRDAAVDGRRVAADRRAAGEHRARRVLELDDQSTGCVRRSLLAATRSSCGWGCGCGGMRVRVRRRGSQLERWR